MRRYFYGIVSYILRIVTKKRKKIIPIGIPKISAVNLFGIGISQRAMVVSKRFRGYRGSVKIDKIPSTVIKGNTSAMRKAWLGIRVRGFLFSPNIFCSDFSDCIEQLEKKGEKNYAEFLRKIQEDPDYLLFERCFSCFKR